MNASSYVFSNLHVWINLSITIHSILDICTWLVLKTDKELIVPSVLATDNEAHSNINVQPINSTFIT